MVCFLCSHHRCFMQMCKPQYLIVWRLFTLQNLCLPFYSCIVGIGYPVYSSFKAIEKKDMEEREHMLIYWAVYGCFLYAEVFTDTLLHRFFYITIWSLQFLFDYNSHRQMDPRKYMKNICGHFFSHMNSDLI